MEFRLMWINSSYFPVSDKFYLFATKELPCEYCFL